MTTFDAAFKTYIKGERDCLCCSRSYGHRGKLKKLLSKLRRRLDKKQANKDVGFY